MRLHLETCDQCRRLVVTDRELLAMLDALPSYAPRPGFTDRVMARVTMSGPASVPVLSYPRLTARRAAAMVSLAAGLIASVAWSAANRALLEGWLRGLGTDLVATGWTWLRAAGANLTEQPWFGTIAQTWDSPVRLVTAIVVFLGAYALGLVTLRRLITPSGEPASANA